MKKLLFAFAIVLFSTFFYQQVKAQCEDCLTPYNCYTFELEVPNCGLVTYTVCYWCYATHPGMDIRLLSIKKMCSNVDMQVAIDVFYNWLKNPPENSPLCLAKPCNEGEKQVITSRLPYCGNMIHRADYGSIYDWEVNPDCEHTCVVTWKRCYCLCTPECYDEICPRFHYTNEFIENHNEGSGSCTEVETGPGTKYKFEYGEEWEIPCQFFPNVVCPSW